MCGIRTTEQFRMTRRWVPCLTSATGIDYGDSNAGYIYADGLVIFDNQDGSYELVILHDVQYSSSLAALEERLYAFYCDEEFFR